MNKTVLNFGPILGIIMVGLATIAYAIDYRWMVSFTLSGVVLLIGFGVPIWAAVRTKKAEGGILPFGKAWMTITFTYTIAALIYMAFTLLLYNVIDTELPEKLTKASIEKTMGMMEGLGLPEEQMEQAMEEAEKATMEAMTPMAQVKNSLIGLVVMAVLFLIPAAIVKKNAPAEAEVLDQTE